MPFDYYYQLSPAAKHIYRLSDEYGAIELTEPTALQPFVPRLAEALRSESRARVQTVCNELAHSMCDDLNVHAPNVTVADRRPSDHTGDLYGLYDPEGLSEPLITVWMRSAKRGQVVALKTFLRTLLHEMCHHLDYELLDLDDSLHTEGFFLRESSLFDQLMTNSATYTHYA